MPGEKKDKARVLLIHANSTLDTLIPPNLSIISAVLKQEGHDVRLFDTTFYRTRDSTGDDARVRTLQVKETNFEDLGIFLKTSDMYEDFLQTVRDYHPTIIGLSAVSLTYPFGVQFLKRLRQANLGTPTIVGGVHVSVSPQEVLNEDCVDYICVGEGEYALLDLCDALVKGEPTTNIRNIWAKQDGKIYKNKSRPPVDINALPFQDWSLFDEQRVYKPMAGKIRRTGSFELDRGCPYNCTYCTNSFWHKMYNFRYYRQKDLGRFFEEAEHLKNRYGLEYVYLGSETLLASSEERFMEFVRLWKEKIGLPFWAQTRPETVTEERIKLLEEAGLQSMSIGVESGSKKIREMLNRNMTDEQIISAFDIMSRTGIRVCANNVVGFPDETREQIFETIELNRRLNATNIMIHVFNAYRGTALYDLCVEKGYVSKTDIGGDYRQDFTLKMPQLSREDVLGLQRTFAMYVKFPREMWPEIRVAEKFDEEGNRKFEELSRLYKERFLS